MSYNDDNSFAVVKTVADPAPTSHQLLLLHLLILVPRPLRLLIQLLLQLLLLLLLRLLLIVHYLSARFARISKYATVQTIKKAIQCNNHKSLT